MKWIFYLGTRNTDKLQPRLRLVIFSVVIRHTFLDYHTHLIPLCGRDFHSYQPVRTCVTVVNELKSFCIVLYSRQILFNI